MSIEQYRCWILNNYSTLGSGPHIDLLAGAAAGGTAVLCTYPLDLARTKLAYQVVNTRGNINYGMKGTHHQIVYKGIRDVLSSVYKEGGFRGLYRGVGPTLTGILPYAGLKFYIYEELKLHVPEEYEKSIVMRLSCGALAGLFGQITRTQTINSIFVGFSVWNCKFGCGNEFSMQIWIFGLNAKLQCDIKCDVQTLWPFEISGSMIHSITDCSPFHFHEVKAQISDKLFVFRLALLLFPTSHRCANSVENNA
ncbi:graves disease carrier protein-like [Pyrus ussuriensis x Pyrus communis]|uniref:Graves disease carrier protein-like n=1 Tax=Pyrus ussuriensis x Pyrus communis TaxID=2448454 RepID=A0A5N5GPP2_9ROSA|nr:graves disease carrier protein-like [Pyrus ussuriensis x Pyrus communis]